MLEGLSTNRRCENAAACLAGEGRKFVFRYHSARTTQPEKRLHPREAAELARAGLFIGSVYQDRARKSEDFGAARGEEDGIAALTNRKPTRPGTCASTSIPGRRCAAWARPSNTARRTMTSASGSRWAAC